MVSMNVRNSLLQTSSSSSQIADHKPDLPHPRRCLAHALKMHPHLRHPPKPQHRRRLANNSSFILPRLHIPLPGPVHVQHSMEYRSEGLLHPLFALHFVPDAESVCSDAGEGEGMETRGLLFNR